MLFARADDAIADPYHAFVQMLRQYIIATTPGTFAARAPRDAAVLATLLPELDVKPALHANRGALFDAVAAVRQLGYTPKVTVEQGMKAVAAWAAEKGGPSAILAMERKASTRTEVDDLIRIADNTTPTTISSAPSEAATKTE